MNDLKFTTAGNYMEPDYEPDDGPLTDDQLNQIRKLNMNERIKELAVEAGIISAEYNGFDPTGLTKAQRKFAELIVRECADACYKHKDVESFGIYPIRVAMVTKACSDNIKEHFGVT